MVEVYGASPTERARNAYHSSRIADYIFGRNTLLGVASLMLLAISGYATWSGMNDFIIGISSTQLHKARELVGGLSVTKESLVIAIVVALTFLMWLALRETFGAQRRITERMITLPLYLFLALWSIGFGYGFWWSLIAGEEATHSSLLSLQEDARDAAAGIAARLEAVNAQLDNVGAWSDSQMAREEASGGSCGTTSGAGRGPLYNARRSVRDSVASLRDGVARSWLGPVQAELDQLRQSAGSLAGATIEERQRQFETQAAAVRGRARSIAARSNELGISTAADLRALANAVSIEPGQAGFSCYDPTLAQRLRQAADQASQSAEPRLREASFNEGPAGVANAVKNLWRNVGTYSSSLVSFVASGGQETVTRTASGEPITGRDVIALLATIGVDFGILGLAVLNPAASGPIRRDGLAATQARLHLPTASVVRQLATAINTAIARAPGADFEWVRRHFIHHQGASYFIIPNLYSSDQADKNEELRALAMNQLAGVFADLNLVRPLKTDEWKRLGEEEEKNSYSDLTRFRRQYQANGKAEEQSGGRRWFGGRKTEEDASTGETKPLRNHGLLSKAQRALDIVGWSAAAQKDVEIFRLVDTEGLTPLLTVLNEGTPARGVEPVSTDDSDGRVVPMMDYRREN
ncbi:MAG: hypothetical protein ACLPKB_19555 [Xanthobacteraceae bacterium]